MATIEWHPKAIEDLKLIFDYISRDSPHYAKLTIQSINKQVDNLKKFSQIGRKVPELNNKDIREIIIQNYRVIYQTTPENIIILAIFHSRQSINL